MRRAHPSAGAVVLTMLDIHTCTSRRRPRLSCAPAGVVTPPPCDAPDRALASPSQTLRCHDPHGLHAELIAAAGVTPRCYRAAPNTLSCGIGGALMPLSCRGEGGKSATMQPPAQCMVALRSLPQPCSAHHHHEFVRHWCKPPPHTVICGARLTTRPRVGCERAHWRHAGVHTRHHTCGAHGAICDIVRRHRHGRSQ